MCLRPGTDNNKHITSMQKSDHIALLFPLDLFINIQGQRDYRQMVVNKRIITLIIISAVISGVGMMCFITYKSFQYGARVGKGNAAGGNESDKSFNTIPVVRAVDIPQEEREELVGIYAGMKEENPDFAGYISVPGSYFGYPVMYTPYDPEKYLHKDLFGVQSDDGLPFIDARCNLEPESDNIIIYGHNMKDGSMFASLFAYQDKSYFEEHPVIRFDTENELREYEVMSVFYDRVYYEDEEVFKFYNFIEGADEVEYDKAIKQYLKKSVYDTGITAEYGDKLVTLVTCAYHTENGRFVIVARRKEH